MILIAGRPALGNDSAVAAEKRTRSKLLGHQRPHGFKSPEFIVDAYTEDIVSETDRFRDAT
jgi:hypothetical protein